MKSKKTLVLLGSIFIVVTTVWAWDRFQDHQVEIKVETATALYASEDDAAFRRTNPVKTIKANEKLKVISTTYGKDYWALFVETSDGSKGWVDSGQPEIVVVR